MKKLNLSLAAIFAMGTFAVAGGDIAPVEPVVEEPVVVAPVGNFYIGAAYGYANVDASITERTAPYRTESTSLDSYNTFMLQAGYNFNEYIAIEGRYWFGLDEDYIIGGWSDDNYSADFDTWGLYVKPQYPVTDAFNIYALLGYANTDSGNAFRDTTADGFSWGLGASYAFTENFSVFIDYVDMYNDSVDYVGKFEPGQPDRELTADLDVDTWNFGVTYSF
jgi:opacity protein-like surface antigen